jgi:hypothetical protein
MPRIAESVVVDLSRKGRDMFCVDGDPFPWWISEEGPQVTRIADDLYSVWVGILGFLSGHSGDAALTHGGLQGDEGWPQPVIIGIEFPWYISSDGFTYRSGGSSEVPVVELEFFTKSVEGIPIADEAGAPEDGKVREASGYVIARTAWNK